MKIAVVKDMPGRSLYAHKEYEATHHATQSGVTVTSDSGGVVYLLPHQYEVLKEGYPDDVYTSVSKEIGLDREVVKAFLVDTLINQKHVFECSKEMHLTYKQTNAIIGAYDSWVE